MKALLLAVLRVALGSLFVYAAATKLPDMAAFADDLANYRMVPAALIPLVASAVVGTEVVAGLALIVGTCARAASWVIGGLLVVFIVGLSQALLRGIDLRCGCFGGAELATWGTVGRDAVMLLAAAILVRFGPGKLLWFRKAE